MCSQIFTAKIFSRISRDSFLITYLTTQLTLGSKRKDGENIGGKDFSNDALTEEKFYAMSFVINPLTPD